MCKVYQDIKAGILLGNFMIWKHSEGWSAVNQRTGEYVTSNRLTSEAHLRFENDRESEAWNCFERLEDLLNNL